MTVHLTRVVNGWPANRLQSARPITKVAVRLTVSGC